MNEPVFCSVSHICHLDWELKHYWGIAHMSKIQSPHCQFSLAPALKAEAWLVSLFYLLHKPLSCHMSDVGKGCFQTLRWAGMPWPASQQQHKQQPRNRAASQRRRHLARFRSALHSDANVVVCSAPWHRRFWSAVHSDLNHWPRLWFAIWSTTKRWTWTWEHGVHLGV